LGRTVDDRHPATPALAGPDGPPAAARCLVPTVVRATGVNPSCGGSLRPNRLRAALEPVTVRSRGLMYSSMPKLMSARLVPRIAMASPGGMYHHHIPDATAELEVASNSIVPQL